MKKVLLLLTMFLLTQAAISQVIQQKGVAYRYNGKQKRTPLGNVTISYAGNSRSVISGEDNGTFSLMLEGKKMGDCIGVVTVKKREMMVFNQQAVDEWNIRKEPLTLILCNADEFERQKENLIAIGRSQAKKKYERQKAELEKKLQEGEIKMAEKEAALDKAYEELERLQNNIGVYADLFARIDESEIDTLAQQAMDFFNRGEVERAIELFEQGHYMEQLDKVLQLSLQADKLRIIAEQAKIQASEDSLKTLQSLKAQIEAYKVNNEWEKAGELLKGLADRLKTYNTFKQYASFCHYQNNFDEAEAYYKRALNFLVQKFANRDSLNYDELDKYAEILSDLGYLYNDYEEREKAKEVLEQSLRIRRSLIEDYYYEYSLGLATTLVNIGNLYGLECDYERSEKAYLEALDVYEKLTAFYGDDYFKKKKAITLNNLGISYMNQERYEDSERFYKAALIIRRELAKGEDDDSAGNLAWTLNDIGNLQIALGNYEKSINYLKESYEIRKILSEKNPDAYEPDLILTLNNLSEAYIKNDMLEDGEHIVREAINIYHKLSLKYPKLYATKLTHMVNSLEYILLKTDRKEEIENVYLEELSVWEPVKDERIEFEAQFANSMIQLAECYKDNLQFEKAESLYVSVLPIMKVLADIAFDKYGKALAYTYYCIGHVKMLYVESQQNAIPFLLEASNNYYNVLKCDTTISRHHLETLRLLETLYLWNKQYSLSIEIAQKRFVLCERCYNTNPKVWQSEYSDALSSYSRNLIFLGNFKEAEKYARESFSLRQNKTGTSVIPLAFSLLFQGKYTDAEVVVANHKDVLLNERSILRQYFLKALQQYAEAGVIPKECEADVEKIKRLLNE